MMKRDIDTLIAALLVNAGLALAAAILIGLGTNFYLGFGVVALALFMKGK